MPRTSFTPYSPLTGGLESYKLPVHTTFTPYSPLIKKPPLTGGFKSYKLADSLSNKKKPP